MGAGRNTALLLPWPGTVWRVPPKGGWWGGRDIAMTELSADAHHFLPLIGPSLSRKLCATAATTSLRIRHRAKQQIMVKWPYGFPWDGKRREYRTPYRERRAGMAVFTEVFSLPGPVDSRTRIVQQLNSHHSSSFPGHSEDGAHCLAVALHTNRMKKKKNSHTEKKKKTGTLR